MMSLDRRESATSLAYGEVWLIQGKERKRVLKFSAEGLWMFSMDSFFSSFIEI